MEQTSIDEGEVKQPSIEEEEMKQTSIEEGEVKQPSKDKGEVQQPSIEGEPWPPSSSSSKPTYANKVKQTLDATSSRTRQHHNYRSTMYIPKPMVGWLIGKEGKNVREINANTGATITILQRRDNPELSTLPCRIEGTASEVNDAISCIRHSTFFSGEELKATRPRKVRFENLLSAH